MSDTRSFIHSELVGLKIYLESGEISLIARLRGATARILNNSKSHLFLIGPVLQACPHKIQFFFRPAHFLRNHFSFSFGRLIFYFVHNTGCAHEEQEEDPHVTKILNFISAQRCQEETHYQIYA